MNIARVIATVITIGCEWTAAVDSDRDFDFVLLRVGYSRQLYSAHSTGLDGYFI